MADVFRTKSYLTDTSFVDNTTKAITPQRLRDFVVSAFGSPTVVDTTYAISIDTDTTVLAGHATTAFAVTLPTAVSNAGKVITIKNTNVTIITIATTSSQTIDQYTTVTLEQQHQSVTVESDGTNWKVTGGAN